MLSDTPKTTEPTLGEAIQSIPEGWTWELRRYWNHPWAKQFCFTLHSPHGEPDVHTSGMTPVEVVIEAVNAIS